MGSLLSGEATPAQTAGFLLALRAKGETAAEVAVLVDTMMDNAVPLPLVSRPAVLVDTCGTGGDRSGTVNISTMSALVVAATGEVVAKHGNRAQSSSTGSADVLAELGIPFDLTPEQVATCIEEAGIGFCFAPTFHPAMRHVGPTRRELGVPTIFNVLGPLANPAGVQAQLVGVAHAPLAWVVAEALALRGTSALVVRGEDGLDEVSTCAPTEVWEVYAGEVVAEHRLTPEDLGVACVDVATLAGGDAARNARVVRDLVVGAQGPITDAVVVNAAAALVAADSARGDTDGPLVDRWRAAIERARTALSSGAAAATLEGWIAAAAPSSAPG
jgi:anthranilate phosphoribosyltransferase